MYAYAIHTSQNGNRKFIPGKYFAKAKGYNAWTYQIVRGQSRYPFANQKTECFAGLVVQSL